MKRWLFLLLTAPAFAQNATVTANVMQLNGGAAQPTGTSVRVDLQNCTSPRIPGTGNISSKSQTFYPNTSGIATITLWSNTVIDCGSGVPATPVSFYTFNLVSNGGVTSLGSYKVPAGSTTLDTLTPINTTPVIPTPSGDNTYLRLDLGNWGDLTQPLPPVSATSVTTPQVTATNVNGVFYSRSGDTIASIESECSAACTYIVGAAQTITLSANHTLSSKVNLQFANSGVWTVNGDTLTIPGHVDGTLSQHFTGSGSIQFGSQQPLVPVEWFGAVADWNGTTGTNNLTAIQTAINAVQSGQILLQQGGYAISGTLNITKSNVGIKGTVPGGTTAAAVTTTLSASVIVNTSASTDTIDVAGQSASARLLYNQFDHFALTRSVAPSVFSVRGLSINYVAGAIVEYVQSLDSGVAFYFHSAPSFGIGVIKHCWANWGSNGFQEGSGDLSLTGFFLDSQDGAAENSITIDESAATSALPDNSLPVTYGLYILGTAINDVDSYGFGAGTMDIGIYVQYTGGGSAADLHFVKSTLDGCRASCIYTQGIQAAALGSVEFNGGWANNQAAASSQPTVQIFASDGVSVRGMQISNSNPAGLGVTLSSSNRNTITDNLFMGTMVTDISLAGSSYNVVNGNSMNYPATTAIAAVQISSHNSMIGNVIGGQGSTTNGITFDSTSQFNVGASYDNVLNATNLIVDPSGLNGAFIPVTGTVREITGTATSVPTVAAQSGAGSGATVSLVTGSNDYNGAITLTTGTSPTSSSVLVAMTFGTAKRTAPVFTLTPGNPAAANLGTWTNGISNSVVQLNSGTTAPAASTTYVWSYVITGLSQ